jgi:hypothetical protein
VNRWLKFVAVLLFAGIVVAVVSPDLDLHLTVASVSGSTRSTQGLHAAAFAAIITTNELWVRHAKLLPLAVLSSGPASYHPNLIDLNCTRLC